MKSPRIVPLCMSVALLLWACGSDSRFPVEKRFWDPEDYSNVIFEIGYRIPKGDAYPRFSDPETGLVIRKLVDAKNYEVLLNDSELGMNYRSEVSEKFFENFRDLYKAYSGMDIQDKYIYPEELIEIAKFGLGLQIKYFRLGNDRIVEQADDPKAASVREVIRSNERTIIGNFTNYLDHFGEEKYFGDYADLLADGITVYFFKLIEAFPNGNYESMLNKSKLMLKKAERQPNKAALEKLIHKLESMKSATL